MKATIDKSKAEFQNSTETAIGYIPGYAQGFIY